MDRQKLLCIVGPTASGKTALSVELAKRTNGRIISADSMQIYRGADIGTAKPTAEERQGIVHYMIDVCDISEEYSVAEYVRGASDCIAKTAADGAFPIAAGGTGMYMDSLVRGEQFAEGACADARIRKELEDIYAQPGGAQALMDELERIDSQSAQRLHINDKRRIVRAVEVFRVSGKTITEHNEQSSRRAPKYDAYYIGIAPRDKELLHERINLRVDMMERDGLEQEARRLLLGGNMAKTAAQAIGYKEFTDYFNGLCSKQQAIEQIKLRTRQYAKRQMTWFKRNKNIFWIYYDKDDNFSKITDIATEFAKRCGVL